MVTQGFLRLAHDHLVSRGELWEESLPQILKGCKISPFLEDFSHSPPPPPHTQATAESMMLYLRKEI